MHGSELTRVLEHRQAESDNLFIVKRNPSLVARGKGWGILLRPARKETNEGHRTQPTDVELLQSKCGERVPLQPRRLPGQARL